jgi:hypothetical protein
VRVSHPGGLPSYPAGPIQTLSHASKSRSHFLSYTPGFLVLFFVLMISRFALRDERNAYGFNVLRSFDLFIFCKRFSVELGI